MSKELFKEISNICSERIGACNNIDESLNEALGIYRALLENTAIARLCIENIFSSINASDAVIDDVKRDMDSLAMEILDIKKDN